MPRAYGSFRHTARDFYAALRFASTGGASVVTWASPPAFVTSLGFSICGWVKVGGSFSLGTQQVYQNTTAAGTPPQFRVTTSGTIELIPRGGGVSLAGGTVPRGEWTHVACTWDNVTATHVLYINGEIVASGTGSYSAGAFSQPTDMQMQLNAASTGSRLCVWGYPLTQAQIRAEMYGWEAPTPLARYSLNRGYGTTSAATDDLGGTAGTIAGCTFTDDVPTRPARLDMDWSSISLDGTGDYVSTTANTVGQLLSGQAGLTLSAWAKLPAQGAQNRLIDFTSNGTAGARLAIDTGNLALVGTFRSRDADSAQVGSASFAADLRTWNLYTAQADFAAGLVRLYRNGVQIASTAATFGATTHSSNEANNTLTIGSASGGASANITGGMGQVRIDGLITNQQIRDIALGRSAVTPLIQYMWREQTGTAAANTGSATGATGTLQADTAWSLDAPW